jgi:hydroxyacyl-ACP dehydratase HTD2-like protein with hotdog domain
MSEDLKSWVGRSETVRDRIGATPVDALNATLDHTAERATAGDALPPLWHWLYFLPLHRQSEIGADGPTAMRSAALSCRRCRCRGACGRAASSSSARPFA